VLLRRTQYRLDQIDHRLEVLGGISSPISTSTRSSRSSAPRRAQARPDEDFQALDVQAEAILNMRLRNLRKLDEMEIKTEDKDLRAERKTLQQLIGSEKEQWKKVADEIKDIRTKFGPKTPLGKRRTTFAQAPEHDAAAIEEALVEREPITVVVSEKGWIRALRGTVTDLFRHRLQDRRRPEVRVRGRDHLEVPGVRHQTAASTRSTRPSCRADAVTASRSACSPTSSRRPTSSPVFRHQGGRKFLVGSSQGRGFVVPEDECLANTRKGKQVLNVTPPDEAAALAVVEGELVASIGEPQAGDLPARSGAGDGARGRACGCTLQGRRLSDLKTFQAGDGLTWVDAGGRVFTQTIKELAAWRGNRGDAGRVRPDRFSPTTSSARCRGTVRRGRRITDHKPRRVGRALARPNTFRAGGSS